MNNAIAEASDTAPWPGASLPQAMGRFMAGTFRLRGRASRSEYWWWMLVNVVFLGTTQLLIPTLITGRMPETNLVVGPFGSWLFANVHLFSVSQGVAPSSPAVTVFLLFALLWLIVTVIPGFTIAVRRLHDSNLSGWWALLALIPPGGFVLLLLAARSSRPEGARFDL
ncbi:Uncharacterized membrane protein YhaH, DUF805 family [Agromyces sp. CF514]|uniref:DUF805 domain-containing protein n=1 Tax=Agromyces sp. CF514 TaxID=1881031 RepID=UPI0008DFB178|nr:DUF805 domain-containing protein [Agromyces sp. CF514]SFR67731.1 Uncharacterized membrane protein YhaH, DUF805 family [Agromyces sp. CF514]